MVDLTCQCIYLVVIYIVLLQKDYEWLNDSGITVTRVNDMDQGQNEDKQM